MGNTNELLSQARRCNILQCVDKTLEKYGKDPAPSSRDTLFGHDFCTQLKGKVDSDTTLAQVVSISKRYHPYADKQRQSTLGRGSQQFFRDGPAGRTGSWQGNQHFFLAKPWYQQAPTTELSQPAVSSQPPGEVNKILDGLPLPHITFQTLQLDLSLISQYSTRPVGGRTALFITNWAKLTQDQWVLTTVQGYELPLNQWPTRNIVPTHRDATQAAVLLEEVQKLAEKGAAQLVRESQTYLPYICKSGGGWRPIIDLRFLNSFLEPPHFKMEGLYMLPTILKHRWQMAKDAYLTIPVAQQQHCLLSFRVPTGQWMQFNCLPFGLCTAPFVFTKVTKPIVHFLRKLGVHLIIYLVDFSPSGTRQVTTANERLHNTEAFHGPGIRGQPAQECSVSHPADGVLGLCDRHCNDDYSSTCPQDRGDTEGSFSSARIKRQCRQEP